MGVETTEVIGWRKGILKEVDKGGLRLEKIGKLRKKKSRKRMGQNKIKRNCNRKWRKKDEAGIWKR
jgi:hypothetical protein